MEMENNNKLESTEDVNFNRRTSFSWDTAFFTSDDFLADEEFSSMIEGGGDDEAKLFKKIEASTQTSKIPNSSINLSSGKNPGSPRRDAPIKTSPTRSSPVSGGSPGNNVKTPTRRSTSSKTGKANTDSPSETPPRIITKNKEASVNTRISRTSPASPVSPGSTGSASSIFAVNQRSKRSDSAPSRSSANEKSSKPAVSLMRKTQSSISLKIKPSSVISHPSSPSTQSNSQRPSESPTSSRGIKGSTVHHTSKQPLKNHHTGQTSDTITCKTGGTNGSKTAAAANAGLKPNSRKTTTPKKQSRGTENILVISPELLDLQGKINALKMEISLHKKERCNKMALAEGTLKTPLAI